MSAFNGSGTFVIVGAGLPYVPLTTISSTTGNQLNTDLATGLSNCITKDGQTTVAANIPMSGFKLTGLGVPSALGDALSWNNPVSLTTVFGNPSFNGTATFTAPIIVGAATFNGAVTGFANMTWNADIITAHVIAQGAGGGNFNCTGFGISAFFDVSGINSSASITCRAVSQGVILNNNSTAWASASDYRAKNVEGLFIGASGIVQAIPVHLAAYKEAPEKVRAMFLAHEVQDGGAGYAVCGEKDAVDEDGKPVYQTLESTDPMVPVLWAALQETMARVAALETAGP